MTRLKTVWMAPLVVALMLSACSQEENTSLHAADSTAADTAAVDTASADLAFIDRMVPHHRQAVDLARLVIDEGRNADVKAFAEKLRTMQSAEIDSLQEFRERLSGSGDFSLRPDTTEDHMEERAEAQLDSLKALDGPALDAAFLDRMIAHHEEGLAMMRERAAGLTDERLRTLADKMQADQQRDIEEMQRLKGTVKR